MDKSIVVLLVILAVLTASFLLHNYIFSIYETKFTVSSNELYADGKSQIVITAIPVNGLGFRAPFRDANTVFSIEQGTELVDIISNDRAKGVLVIRGKFVPGQVSILAKPKYAMFPTRFEVTVLMNLV